MQVERPNEPDRAWSWLLASDLDGTLIPVEPLDDYEREIERFARTVADPPGGMLAYITGRHMSLALDGIRDAGLPEPAVLVCDVGTALLDRTGHGVWRENVNYARRMADALGGTSAREQAQSLDSVAWLTPQEDEKQATSKQSYYFPGERDADEVREELARRLDAAGAICNLVVSHDPADGRGLVDVLPRGVNKATALAYLRERTGLPPDRIVFAGDSDNDAAALTSGCRGILVANAALAVRNRVATEAARLGILGRIHFAARPLAAGVIEGCERFGIFGRGAG